MKKAFTLLVAAVAIAAAPAAKQDRDIVDTALSVHKFNTFLMLLTDADLTFTLKRAGPYTVFAPVDDYFARMPKWKMDQLRSNKAELRQLILSHVVRGRVTAQEAIRRSSLRTMAGTRLSTDNVDGRGMVGNANFEIPNVMTSNGILHGMSGW